MTTSKKPDRFPFTKGRTARPFLEELGEVMSEVWHGSPVEFDEHGDEIVSPPGLAVIWAEVRADVRDAWRAHRGGDR